MSEQPVQLKIDEGLIRGILEKRIEAEIVQALGNPTELIGKVVRAAMRIKVNSEGKRGSYSSDNRYDFIEIMCERTIQQMARDSFMEWLEANKAIIRTAVIDEMKRPQRQKTIAKAFADAVENGLTTSWNMKCQVDLIKKD